MSATKDFTVRYYVPCIGENGEGGTLASLLDIVASQPAGLGKVRIAGTMVHQVRIHKVNPNKKEYQAFFVRFRDELPRVSKRSSGEEALPVLDIDEEVIEKNHFTLFVEENGVEIIAYQMSMEGSDVSALGRYFSYLSDGAVSVMLNDVIKGDVFEQLQSGILKFVEFEVAKPRSKHFSPNPEDSWTRDALDYMAKTGSTRFSVKIKTTSIKKGLIKGLSDQIGLLFESPQTKKLRVKVSSVNHIIDLFADRIFDKFAILIYKGWPDSHQMFSKIKLAKDSNLELAPYLADKNEALN